MMITYELIHEPEHYNATCGCTIPEAWTAFIQIDNEQLPKWPCGSTEAEARANVLREYPGAKEQ